MGGRKQRRPVRTRPLPSIPKIFDCPRCESTAIRISMESDHAIVECGSCHLKQIVSEIKAIEEAIDIYGNFLDNYYINIETMVPEDAVEDTISIPDEKIIAEDESEETIIEEEVVEVAEVVEEPQIGFVPRSKGDVLKKKQKPKKEE